MPLIEELPDDYEDSNTVTVSNKEKNDDSEKKKENVKVKLRRNEKNSPEYGDVNKANNNRDIKNNRDQIDEEYKDNDKVEETDLETNNKECEVDGKDR